MIGGRGPGPRPKGRASVLGGAPTHTLTTWLSKVRKKRDRVTVVSIGGWGHHQGHSPYRGLTLTRQKEPTGAFLPNPPSPDRQQARALTRRLACRLEQAGQTLGARQGSPSL